MNQIRFCLSLIFALIVASPLVFSAEEELKTNNEKAIERRQKVELLGFFTKDAKDAQLPTTSIAIQLYNQAVTYFQKGDYVLARQSVEESLEQNDTNAFAYELLGEIEYYEQNLKAAKANYEIAYALTPTKSLKEKIEKTLQETKVESKLSTYNEEHFVIKYHNSDSKVEGFELRELLRTTYLSLSRDFAYYFNKQIVVLLYSPEDFKKLTNLPHWVAGVYDGKVRMPMSKSGYLDKELSALTMHEVTHAFVTAMSNGRAPAWINEGIAEFMEDKVRLNDLTIFKAAIKTKTLLSFDEVFTMGETTAQDPLKVGLFYQQTAQLVNYLATRYSMFHIKQLLGEFAKGKNSDEAIREIFKISPQKLEQEWKSSLGLV